MNDTVFMVLIHNAALLITLAYAYSLISVREKERSPFWMKLVMGGVVCAIGVCIMLTSWELEPGIVFDTRSVLLAGSGMFLGAVPTVIAMVAAGIFCAVQGGLGAWAAIAAAYASGSIGLIWRWYRKDHLADISWAELYVFGLVVHLVMLALFFLMPLDDAIRVLSAVALPIMIIYPPVTMLFGRMMSHRLQRERAAARLRESEQRYRSLFENNHAVMLITDPEDGRIIDANSAAESFYGWRRDEMRNKSLDDIASAPESGNADDLSAIRNDEAGYYMVKHGLADGQQRYVEIYRGQITIEGRDLMYSIVHDVTEHKRLEEQLRQAQKMDAVGRLAGGVAHDYNNKLQAVLGFSEMAMHDAKDQPVVYGYLEEIRDAAKASAQLTLQLMAFARKQTVNPVVIGLNEAINRQLKMLKKLVGEDVKINWKPGDDLWSVMIDPSQLDQIMVNLALNARDAIPDVGMISIETQNLEIEKGTDIMNPDAKPGEYVMISVSDTGNGMSEEELEHIFEPFFTTKEVGKGTGLGLAMVYGVVSQNGGFIHVHSAPGEGTSFKVYLPRSVDVEEPVKEAKPESAPAPEPGDETVLLVEDEELVLDLVRKTLESYGYTVLSSSEPEEALEMAEKHQGKIDALVTDVIMPGMNGRALYEKISKIRPETKVLYMSGYTADAIIRRGVIEPGIDLLQKPFSGTAMASKLREVLDSSMTVNK